MGFVKTVMKVGVPYNEGLSSLPNNYQLFTTGPTQLDNSVR